ncbi:complex I 30 kDa subunit family protein [Anaplasma platys]|nr:NADH-quinone oxidoreductase subunit C [Anaplasma platys]
MTVGSDEIAAHISELLCIEVTRRADGVLECNLQPDKLVGSLTVLKNDQRARCNMLTDIFAVDYHSRSLRFEVLYMLLSIVHNVRACCKVAVAEGEVIPSVTEVFGSSGWFEREVYDMYGIKFSDHPDLRRILTDYGFKGYPMLKDFPVTGYEEIRYDLQQGKVVYQPVNLQQGFRSFNAMSPWKGDRS